MKMYLTFICRDNEDVIADMINSCLPIIDGIIVCDTGSKDKTIQIIRDTLTAHNKQLYEAKGGNSKKFDFEADFLLGKPIHVYEDKWVNFGHNRTIMMEHCRKHPEANYVLVMDSDETLVIHPEFNRKDLKNDCIMINTPGDAYTYPRDRIFSNEIHWEWKGAAHEFPHSDQMQSKKIDPNLHLVLRPKPAGYDKHIRRNLKLLLEDFKKEPNDARTNFYVGLSYRDLNQPDKAREHLKRRGDMENTWDEERWYAKYITAVISENEKEYDRAKKEYLEAYEFRPSRSEPLFNLGKMLYGIDQRNQAIMYIRMAAAISEPLSDSVFVESSVYDWGCKFELSHMLYYDLATIDEGYELASKILGKEYNLPEHIRQRTYENLRLYDNYFISIGRPKRFVIELPPGYDGLGDHLLYSHLPEIIVKTLPGIPVYVSNFNTYKTGKTIDVVWTNNPYVSGFVDAKGTYRNMEALTNIMSQKNMVLKMSMMDQIAIFYGLNPTLGYDEDGTYNECLPKITIKKKDIVVSDEFMKKIEGKVIYDGNWKHYAGVTQKQVIEFFEKRKVKVDVQIAQFGDTEYIELPGVKKITLKGIYDYVKLFVHAKNIYTLMTGTAILSAAYGEGPINVLIGPCVLKNYQFHEVNNYIILS